MKSFPKIAMIILMGMMYMTTNAQSVLIKGGGNLSTLHGIDEEEDAEYNWKPGFHIGLATDFPLTERFSLEIGTFLSTRGFKESYEWTFEDLDFQTDLTYMLYYLEVPVTAKIRIPVNTKTNMITQFGGYCSYGLFNTYVSETTSDDESFKESDSTDWAGNRLDAGLTLGAGIERGRWLAMLSYDHGLRTFFGEDSGFGNLKLSVGYTIFSR